ncbi:TPA: hypothetical protein DEP94_00915 [Candidatus Nomurabacteria bacterium]|nr:hypothetical protein [Candidatus Nomurabacteria bacterium]
MKKNVLALSITAALVGLGFAGTGVAAATSSPSVVDQGMFTSFPANTPPMIEIRPANADKTGFLGAAKSDDVFDFQVFLSPSEVLAANMPQTLGMVEAKASTDT